MAKSKKQKLMQLLRSPSGWLHLILKVARKAAKPVYRRERIIELCQEMKLREIPESDFNLNLCRLDDPETLALFQSTFPLKAELFKQRLDKGVTGLGILSDEGDVVSYTWFATSDYYEPQNDFTYCLKENTLYQFDGFVRHRYREKYKCVMNSINIMLNDFYPKGFRKNFCLVDVENEVSMKLHRVLGFKETGRMIVTHFIFRKPFSQWRSSPRSFLKRKRKK